MTPPDALKRNAVLHDLSSVVLFADRRWRPAVDGDPSAAVGLALEHVWTRRIADIRRDLILTALWACASAGDPASKLLLAVLRERVDEARSA
ncbi:hypothetical protein [Chenggangzhangella methanolivorans]|uniref:Uncharacterized protein n=1 Tax=Chenggangzhangella methanolivorans TaxID=1437009 RepID=A0A9E6UPQ7_9HYPH|nr:hypothetical protein [Chenggangzhangella methanolivorans]QZO01669.1 hypothetical protein K6K41_09865 [Chenggangzhangella methanolivorans]